MYNGREGRDRDKGKNDGVEAIREKVRLIAK